MERTKSLVVGDAECRAAYPLADPVRRVATVLLVDDDAGDLILLEQALRLAAPDAEIRTARRQADALQESVGADLIVLDLNMPGTHGLEVLADLRAAEATRSTPIVVLTTSGASRDIEGAYAGGANAFITKPGDLAGTIEMMKTMAGFWLEVACAS